MAYPNNRDYVILSLVISAILLIGCYTPLVQAANILFTVKTNNGSLVITSQNNTLPIIGINGIDTSSNKTTVIISYNKIISFGMLEHVSYIGSQSYSYYNDQFVTQSQYVNDVLNAEPFNGKIVYVYIIPVSNTLTQPLVFTLYINNINTKNILIINPHQTIISVNKINIPFNFMDNVYWLAQSNDTSGNIFVGNIRVLINYSY